MAAKKSIVEEARLLARATHANLIEEGRKEEADAFNQALKQAASHDAIVRVSWTGDADIDLDFFDDISFSMSCAVMCYPKVKETLEGLEGVESVELVTQKEEGVIDDRRVTVKFDGDLTSDKAVAALTDAGFPDSTFE